MACDAASLISSAYSNKYNQLSDRDLLACILAAACAGGGGSGSGTGAVYKGTTAARNATTPTTTDGALWVLTDSSPPYQISVWTGSAWQ